MSGKLRRFLGALGWACIGLLLLFALGLALLRQFLPGVGEYREQLALLLSEQTGVPVDIGALHADWNGRWPRLELDNVRVFGDGPDGPELRMHLDRLSVELNLSESLLRWQPVLDNARIDGLMVNWHQRDGAWLHRPVATGTRTEGMKPAAWNELLGLILLQSQISVHDSQLTLIPERGGARQLRLGDLVLENSADEHQLRGRLEQSAAGRDGHLRFAIETRAAAADLFDADFNFYLSLERWGPQLLNLDLLPVRFKKLQLNTQLWGRFSHGALEHLRGHLGLAKLQIDKADLPALDGSSTDFALLPDGDAYQLQLNHLKLSSAGAGLEIPQVLFEGRWRDGKLQPVQVAGPAFDLRAIGGWLQHQPFVPALLGKTLHQLAPTGELRNLRIDWPDGQGWKGFQLVGDLHGASVKAAWGAPEASGISGRVEASRQGGRLDLASDDFKLFFPELYDRGWAYNRAGGVLRWSLEPDRIVVDSELLHLANDAVSAAGRFSLVMPLDEAEQSELTLLIGMTDSDARQTRNYVPPDLVGRPLYNWLDGAIKAGHLRQGGFVLHGGTRHQDALTPLTVQMFFDVGDAEMAYQPGWPAVKDGQVFVLLRDQALQVEVEKGRLLDSRVEHARIALAGSDQPLEVTGQVRGGAADILGFLQQSPLKDALGPELANWQLQGQATTDVRLDIPLTEGQNPKVSVGTRLKDGQFGSKDRGVDFSALQGDLRYSLARGLRSDSLKGRLFGQSVVVRISTPDPAAPRTRVELSGKLPMPELVKWSGVDLLGDFSGTAAYDARLDLCSGADDCDRLVIASDLQGVAIPWPAPLGKVAEDSRPLSLVLDLNDSTLRFNYDGRLRAVFDVATGAPLRGRLTFGGTRPALPEAAGLWLDGHLDVLNLDQVQDFLGRKGWLTADRSASAAAASLGQDAMPLRDLDLDIGTLRTGQRTFDQVHAHLTTSPWQLELSSPLLTGRLEWPAAAGTPYRLSLDTLRLPKPDPAATASTSTPPGDAAPIDLSGVPPVDVSIASLNLGDKAFGRWQFGLRPAAGSLRVEKLEGHLGSLQFTGEGRWQETPSPETDLTLKVTGKDLGDALGAWGNDKVLESNKADVSLQMSWPQRPWALKLAQAQGNLQFRLRDGRVIDSGSASNVLRIFGILNLNSLARRFKLDFSDLLKKGLAYDKLDGRYHFENGIARTLEPLKLEGPSADMTMTGQLDLGAETLDQEMEVTLPLTSNIPLAAVLLGAPQVAGAMFLLDKLIGDKLEKVTAIRYRLSGNWDNPDVSVIRSAPKNAKEPLWKGGD